MAVFVCRANRVQTLSDGNRQATTKGVTMRKIMLFGAAVVQVFAFQVSYSRADESGDCHRSTGAAKDSPGVKQQHYGDKG